MAEYVLTMSCSDAPGIIHRVTGVLFNSGYNITEQGEFVDLGNSQFFMRAELEGDDRSAAAIQGISGLGLANLEVKISPIGKKRLVMFVGKEAHCPGDLLIRNFSNDLAATIQAVVSNHLDLEPLVAKFGIPFHHVSAEGMDRAKHEAALESILAGYNPEILVLAKYLRVLSAEFLARFQGSILNIHHSFLPAFVGSKPYHRAHERGVKIIGATAHFVTENLDEGPIVAQDVISVSHRHSVEDFIQAGHDVEKVVLARALRLVLAERVMVYKNRTVVFD